MASLFGHTLAALTLGKLTPIAEKQRRYWVLLCLCSILPDFDALAFVFGIPYQSQWGHRGFTHSFFFALLLSLMVVHFAFGKVRRFSKPWLALLASFFCVTASHCLLDALTNGGLGVAFFWPFDHGRYFFPYRPIEVSPIGITAFFSEQGLGVLQSEALLILLPCAVLIALQYLCRKLFR